MKKIQITSGGFFDSRCSLVRTAYIGFRNWATNYKEEEAALALFLASSGLLAKSADKCGFYCTLVTVFGFPCSYVYSCTTLCPPPQKKNT